CALYYGYEACFAYW
nr:immunoglobulin heavy chain junction region [Mus musculus]